MSPATPATRIDSDGRNPHTDGNVRIGAAHAVVRSHTKAFDDGRGGLNNWSANRYFSGRAASDQLHVYLDPALTGRSCAVLLVRCFVLYTDAPFCPLIRFLARFRAYVDFSPCVRMT